ncbi:hypothetical protein TIFTF001_010353 [Ficus carica]|uniref:Uncharacterized protein n=1 Tax=Ficus carica TaxID=3494 RepID=A0AA88D3C7_FICCA|nr:hypothetical protein TIFTF001_010353 [Ficus carica]
MCSRHGDDPSREGWPVVGDDLVINKGSNTGGLDVLPNRWARHLEKGPGRPPTSRPTVEFESEVREIRRHSWYHPRLELQHEAQSGPHEGEMLRVGVQPIGVVVGLTVHIASLLRLIRRGSHKTQIRPIPSLPSL